MARHLWSVIPFRALSILWDCEVPFRFGMNYGGWTWTKTVVPLTIPLICFFLFTAILSGICRMKWMEITYI